MNLAYKESLFTKYEDFSWEENQEIKKTLRSEIFDIFKKIEKPDSDDFHIWGLTYYMSDDDKKYHKNLAEEKFSEAYQLDSTNFLACLYLAHCFHDKGELKKALKQYELVNKKDLKEFQLWRYVKLIEQIGFCNYQLGNQELGRQQFQEVLECYRKLPDADLAVPTEMLQCLSESDEIVIAMKKINDYLK